MVKELEKLREDEIDVVMKAPIYVAILIAGADGEIDKHERREAVDIANNRQSRSREQLSEYYKEINFHSEFERIIDELPSGVDERTTAIIRELRKLNFILKKVDRSWAIKLHGSLKDLSKKIAEASGGLMSYLTVSYEEAKLMELKMLKNPSTF
ncbi:MAG: hypothetical protein GY816_07665 [Cytophagales bacterium]|nr:hypothetical protein [Cytophagales bacterium]